MRGLVLEEPSKIGEGDVNSPEVGPDDVLLEPLACGVCGGDIKVFKDQASDKAYPYFLRGHEFAGRVLATGHNIRHLREGDIVARCFQDYCGWCLNCRVGRPNFCLNARSFTGGGYADQAADSAKPHGGALYKVPAGMDMLEAAVAEPITCAIGAVLKAKPNPGDRVVVVGLGGIGQFLAQILTSMRAYVIGVDVQPAKLGVASKICAEVIDSSKQDVTEEVMRLTAGVGADIVMEAVGIPATLKQSIDLARMGGKLIIVGAYTQQVDGLNVDRVFRRDLEIRAAKGPSPLVAADGTPLALRYIEEGIVQPKAITRTYPRALAQEAFESQAYGDTIKAVIVPDA